MDERELVDLPHRRIAHRRERRITGLEQERSRRAERIDAARSPVGALVLADHAELLEKLGPGAQQAEAEVGLFEAVEQRALFVGPLLNRFQRGRQQVALAEQVLGSRLKTAEEVFAQL